MTTGRSVEGTDASSTPARGRQRPAVAEVFIAVQVIAIMVAVVIFAVGATRGDHRASCQDEVLHVRTAIAKYRIDFGNANPPGLFPLVSAGFLKAAPDPAGPSVSAGFVYDPKTGTYAGGTCPGQ